MSERKDVFLQWLTLLGSMVGLTCPVDVSDDSQRHFYKQLCLGLHPDKQSFSPDAGHRDRVEHFFKILSDVYDTYSKTTRDLDPPDPDVFQTDDDPVNHDCDRVPKSHCITSHYPPIAHYV